MTSALPIGTSLVDSLRGDELDSLASEVAAGRRHHILKSLDERGRAQELVRQQYSGRYPFELLQNANDAAADAGSSGRARFVLTDNSLIVADNGAGFGEDQVRAICGLGRSSKDPRKSVGYKGLGFKSVGEITSRPQIASNSLTFEFDDQHARQAVAQIAGSLDAGQRLPVYAFPFGIDEGEFGPDAAVVEEARSGGFTTVLRLPLREGVDRAEVEDHLVQSLVPRLLLFLTGIEELELQGTRADFVSVISRDQHGRRDEEEALLETNGTMEHWLVYRRSQAVTQELVKPIGDAWAQVERVQSAIAVPLGEDGRPTTDMQFPLHVYFPTEEATGLPVIVHADFALQLDRRQLGTSPETLPYNEWLGDAAAAFIADVVAPELALRYPNDIAAVAALAQRSPGTGMGQRCVAKCIEALRMARFLPAVDGDLKVPVEALLLPPGVGNAVRAHAHLDLTEMGRLMIPAAEVDPEVRSFLREHLGVEEWALDDALDHLQPPSVNEPTDFYELLVDWAEGFGNRVFAPLVARVPCVRTVTGEWVAPADARVFFPRQRDDVEIPADLPVPIADVPPLDGLTEILAAAGVRDFEWRELMRDYLLPLLVDPATDAALRNRAMRGLRAYFASQRAGDPALQRRVRDVLLPAAHADGSDADLSPAGALYFTSAWTGSGALESLYGPFDRLEFLAIEPPDDSDDRTEEAAFLRWMGVADHPRVLETRAERDTYMTGSLGRHPHRAAGEAWDDWWNLPQVQEARRCPQDHPSSQRLQVSFVLDRFVELANTGDSGRLLTLWAELAKNWGGIYEPATQAVFHCQHTGHGGERDRSAPSLLWYLLRGTDWVPTIKGDAMQQVRPSQAWRLAHDTPKLVARNVPVIDPRMLQGAGLGLATALGVTDAARPGPADLCTLLEDLCADYEAEGETTREVHNAARWAMRTLNDVLVDQGEDPDLNEVPLLARYRGEQLFTTEPVVASDPLLAETWEDHYPILDADRDLRRLHEALGLVVLDDPDDGVQITPVPQGVRDDLQGTIEQVLNRAKPFLAAVAVASTPSREDDVLRGLRRLEVTACDDLVLRYTFRGKTIDREEATSYIAVRQEALGGARRRNIGTAHLEVDPQSGVPDWYSFGPQLAHFLQVPTQGDAFAMLLTGSDDARKQYLTSRRIPLEAIDEMLAALDLPIDDDLTDGVFDFLTDQPNPSPGQFDTGEQTNSEGSVGLDDKDGGEAGDDEPLPPINPNAVTISDVHAGEVEQKSGSGGSGGGLGPAGSADHEQSDRRQREIGRRGEQAAFDAERNRVQAAGFDPSAVVWRSKRNPFAPYDIESIDTDGQRIFIEVKATTGDDPAEPFLISQSELLEALRHRSRFYIYRVTKTKTASPAVHRYQDPATLLAEGRAGIRLSDARMVLGPLQASDG
jgi:hypothetical protein